MKKVLSENEIVEAMDFVLENDESTAELVKGVPVIGLMCRYIAIKLQEKVGQNKVGRETVVFLFARVEREDEYLKKLVDDTALLELAMGVTAIKISEHIFGESEDM